MINLMDFKKWFMVESVNMAAFVRAMLQTGHDTRMVFSDWLEEHDETQLAEFIRLSKQVRENENNQQIISRFNALKGEIFNGLFRHHGLILSENPESILQIENSWSPTGIVSGGKRQSYYIKGNQVVKLSSKKQYTPVALENSPEEFLKAVATLLAIRMSKFTEDGEKVENFRRANSEFFDNIDKLERVILTDYRIPKSVVKRTQESFERILSAATGATNHDLLNIEGTLRHLLNQLSLVRNTKVDLISWAGSALKKIHDALGQ